MGYMGLEKVGESDNASDLRYVCELAFIKELNIGLKDKANFCNTPGFINVALIIESGVLDKFESYVVQEKLEHKKLIAGLEKLVKDSDKKKKDAWGDEGNRVMHHNACKRMLKNVKKFINNLDE